MLSRRTWIKLLAGAAGLVSAPLQAKNDSGQHTIEVPNDTTTFRQLETWIAELPNPQEIGSPTTVCEQTGEAYIEVFSNHFARPGDEFFAESMVVRDMQSAIYKLFRGRASGTIYWRVPLEYQVEEWSRIGEARLDGSHYNPLTKKQHAMDSNWVRVAAYCRLIVAKESI